MADTKKHASGRNIYVDERGRDVYYDRFTKNGYLIQEKNLKSYFMYQNRFILVIIGIILGYNFLASLETCIIIGVIVAIIIEIMFRRKYLPSLITIQGFKPEKKLPVYKQIADGEARGKVILKTFLYLAMSILLVLNAYIEKLEFPMFALSVVVAIISLYACAVNAIALTKMKK